MLIKNPVQKQQIDEFVDTDHSVMDAYYEVIDSDVSRAVMLKKMRMFMKLDHDFFDPYNIVVDILFDQGKTTEATALLKDAYEKALMRIVDEKGRWPKFMRWGFLENRHIMRIIDRYALFCWEEGNTEEALTIFRQLLKVNPMDNTGVRYHILAIRMGLGYREWSRPFEVEHERAFIVHDAIKMNRWFNENVHTFPEEFKEFLDEHEDA